LVIQVDNTTSQNKNCYVIGFLGLLIHLGLFEEAEMYFLPVGHTHEVCITRKEVGLTHLSYTGH
jgi:hypothetical protein